MTKQILLFWFSLFSILSFAQDTNKIKIFRTYSGQHCVFLRDNANYFTTCTDTGCYDLKLKPTEQLEHVIELVMLENHEFWYFENSSYIHHKDSLLFFTGTWKVDDILFRLDFDSISKPISHFEKVACCLNHFDKPIVRNLCVYYAPNKIDPYSYYWTAYNGDMHNYNNQRNLYSNLCTASIPLYLEFPTNTKKMHKFYTYELAKICATMPFVEIYLTYSPPIKLIPRP